MSRQRLGKEALMPSVPRQLRDAGKRALAQGWTIDRTGSGHHRWRGPHGKPTVFTPSTPSDPRSFRNALAKLKRAGLDL